MNTLDNIFIKKGKCVVIDNNNQFTYEVFIHCRFKNYFSVANSELYCSKNEIQNIVERFKIDDSISIVCEMFSAPLWWLIENSYVKYVKPVKQVKTKPIKK